MNRKQFIEKIIYTFLSCVYERHYEVRDIHKFYQRNLAGLSFTLPASPSWYFTLRINKDKKLGRFFSFEAYYKDDFETAFVRTLDENQFIGKTNGEVKLLFFEVIADTLDLIHYHPIKAWGYEKGIYRNAALSYFASEILPHSPVGRAWNALRARKLKSIIEQDPRVHSVEASVHLGFSEGYDFTIVYKSDIKYRCGLYQDIVPATYLNDDSFYFAETVNVPPHHFI